MRITFEYNDDEIHLVKWCLYKCASLLGTGTDEKMKYKHKRIISNVWEIPYPISKIFKNILKGNNVQKKVSE